MKIRNASATRYHNSLSAKKRGWIKLADQLDGYSYDTAGRLLVQTMPNSDTVTYELDENGNKIKLTWPDSYYAEYVFDELNRLTDIKLNGSSSSALNFDYDELSRRITATYLNGCVCSYTWELNNDLSSLEQAFVGSSVTFDYGFNTVHQATSLGVDDSDFFWKPPSKNKNRYSTNNLNQCASLNTSSFGFDDNGNMTSGVFPAGTFSASYDALNRLTQAISGTNTNNYWNDPTNRQGQKEANGTKTGFLYDGSQLIAEYDDTPALLNRYIPGARLDEVLIQIDSSDVVTYLHQDRIGSVVAQTDDGGAVLNKYNYSPFGKTPSLTGSIFGFTGQRYDSEVDMYCYRARYYSPYIGKFLQADPIGYSAGDMNLYAYVGNDPGNLTDPMGLSPDGTRKGSGGFDLLKFIGDITQPQAAEAQDAKKINQQNIQQSEASQSTKEVQEKNIKAIIGNSTDIQQAKPAFDWNKFFNSLNPFNQPQQPASPPAAPAPAPTPLPVPTTPQAPGYKPEFGSPSEPVKTGPQINNSKGQY